jgi:hypothetical protein
MRFKEDEIKTEFKLKKSGNKGWFLSYNNCPYCNKTEHLSIIFGEVSSFTCKRCGEHGSLYKLLEKVDRKDLILGNKDFISTNNKIEGINENIISTKVFDFNLPIKQKPLGFIRIFENDYLESRNFTKQHFEIYTIGISTFDPFVNKDYIIFVCNQFKNEVGWLARSKKSKEEIDAINVIRKQKELPKYLRWQNSIDTDFSNILFGFDELEENTKIVIVVEGVTSKANVDKLLGLFNQKTVKCVASFGKKITDFQIALLKSKNIETVILLYDPDAVKEIKEYSFRLEDNFDNVLVGFIPFKKSDGSNKDPGDLINSELDKVMNTLQSPINFFTEKIKF